MVVDQDNVSSDRIMWLSVTTDTGDDSKASLPVTGFYAKPGGDEDTFSELLRGHRVMRARFPHSSILLMGDANVHLSHLVEHPVACACLHCRPTPADRRTEAALQAARLTAWNTRDPTHASGTVIDLGIGDTGQPRRIITDDVWIAGSDHHLIYTQMSERVQVDFAASLGRIAWAPAADWDAAPPEIKGLLEHTAVCVERASNVTALRPASQEGTIRKEWRRQVLDAAAWKRDVMYTCLGAAMSCVCVRGSKRRRLDEHNDTDDSHATTRAAAERFLSAQMTTTSQFTIALVDPEKQLPLSPEQMVDAIVSDLNARADNDFPVDSAFEDHLRCQLTRIKKMGARHDSLRDPGLKRSVNKRPRDTGPHDMLELSQVLGSLCKSTNAIQGCYAALVAKTPEARRSLLAIINLGRRVGLTSSLWATRRCAPIRKEGPKIVRRMANLRPVSVCSEIARVHWIIVAPNTRVDYHRCSGCFSTASCDTSSRSRPCGQLLIHSSPFMWQALRACWCTRLTLG